MLRKNRIHISHDEHGPIEVYDDGAIRSLHFGSDAKQSAMYVHDPLALALAYTRPLLSPLAFIEVPQKILLIGLGGGALVRFLSHHFPACQLEIIELRQAVTEIANEYFGLPDKDNITLIHGDAATILEHTSDHGGDQYDVIIVDAYDANDVAASTISAPFYKQCRRRLMPHGLLSCNLWSSNRFTLNLANRNLRKAFDGFQLQIPVEGKGNLIALTGNNLQQQYRQSSAKKRVAHVDQRYQLDIGRQFKNANVKSSWPGLSGAWSIK